MRVFVSLPLLALLLHGTPRVNGGSWRAAPSSPLLLPHVVAKDITNSRSLLTSNNMVSLPTSSVGRNPTSDVEARMRGGDSTEDVDQEPETDKNIANETSDGLSDDVARGGHATKTRPRPADKDDAVSDPPPKEEQPRTENVEEQPATAVEPVLEKVNAEEVNVNDDGDAPKKSFRQRRRERKQKKKLNTSAAMYAKKLKNRNTLNIRRKIMHVNFGLFFAGLNHFIPRNKFVPGMTVLTSATLLMELLRYRRGFGWMNDALHFVLGSSLRKHEMEGKFTGSFYFFLGVTVTSALYPTTCATMGICQLALADPSASYFGRQTRHVYWSRIEGGLGGFGRNKGVLGFLGGALFCFPFNYFVLGKAKFGPGGIPGGNQALMKASLALGLAGAFADLAVPTPALTIPKRVCGVRVPPFHVDDNFVVPIVSGYACTQVFKTLGWAHDLRLAKYILF